MTALANNSAQRPAGRTGERVELARYTVPAGERILYGQRVDGVVRVTDNPAHGRGRAFLVERGLEEDGNAALGALIADYISQANLHGMIPMLRCPLKELEASTYENVEP